MEMSYRACLAITQGAGVGEFPVRVLFKTVCETLWISGGALGVQKLAT